MITPNENNYIKFKKNMSIPDGIYTVKTNFKRCIPCERLFENWMAYNVEIFKGEKVSGVYYEKKIKQENLNEKLWKILITLKNYFTALNLWQKKI